MSPIHPDDESIALSSAGRHFMQRGQWKFLKELNSDWELYDLAADPYERINLADAEPEKLQDLLRDFNAHARFIHAYRSRAPASMAGTCCLSAANHLPAFSGVMCRRYILTTSRLPCRAPAGISCSAANGNF